MTDVLDQSTPEAAAHRSSRRVQKSWRRQGRRGGGAASRSVGVPAEPCRVATTSACAFVGRRHATVQMLEGAAESAVAMAKAAPEDPWADLTRGGVARPSSAELDLEVKHPSRRRR